MIQEIVESADYRFLDEFFDKGSAANPCKFKIEIRTQCQSWRRPHDSLDRAIQIPTDEAGNLSGYGSDNTQSTCSKTELR